MNPIELEVARMAFAFIAEEMGTALRRTAYSPNIKERMDASCGFFDEDGRMLAQAEHIPVHLGSMPARSNRSCGTSRARSARAIRSS